MTETIIGSSTIAKRTTAGMVQRQIILPRRFAAQKSQSEAPSSSSSVTVSGLPIFIANTQLGNIPSNILEGDLNTKAHFGLLQAYSMLICC
ncbi:hypothetical protein EMCG_07310 [[Emmonsia] crescens]|uniref:Uncharacterized protein n=1 Tax=[Emmonsia] crescens TaxID=73230 RepID=A0A0G2I9T6_9EURO|nr:hypothetical protein EMCG_07310 [Emmonsia crescens UAMH 3008]